MCLYFSFFYFIAFPYVACKENKKSWFFFYFFYFFYFLCWFIKLVSQVSTLQILEIKIFLIKPKSNVLAQYTPYILFPKKKKITHPI